MLGSDSCSDWDSHSIWPWDLDFSATPGDVLWMVWLHHFFGETLENPWESKEIPPWPHESKGHISENHWTIVSRWWIIGNCIPHFMDWVKHDCCLVSLKKHMGMVNIPLGPRGGKRSKHGEWSEWMWRVKFLKNWLWLWQPTSSLHPDASRCNPMTCTAWCSMAICADYRYTIGLYNVISQSRKLFVYHYVLGSVISWYQCNLMLKQSMKLHRFIYIYIM